MADRALEPDDRWARVPLRFEPQEWDAKVDPIPVTLLPILAWLDDRYRAGAYSLRLDVERRLKVIQPSNGNASRGVTVQVTVINRVDFFFEDDRTAFEFKLRHG